MKNWLILVVWVLPFTLMSNAWATPFSNLEYSMTGDFCAYDDSFVSHNASVTGWLNVELSSHAISNSGTPAGLDLSHNYDLSYGIDVVVDVDNDNDPSNDRSYTFGGVSALKLLTMADMYLDLGDFGLYSTDDGQTNLPWLGEGQGAGLWHYTDFDLDDLSYFTLSTNGDHCYLDELTLSYGFLDFNQVPVLPIPEPLTALLLLIGFTGLTGYEVSWMKK